MIMVVNNKFSFDFECVFLASKINGQIRLLLMPFGSLKKFFYPSWKREFKKKKKRAIVKIYLERVDLRDLEMYLISGQDGIFDL